MDYAAGSVGVIPAVTGGAQTTDLIFHPSSIQADAHVKRVIWTINGGSAYTGVVSVFTHLITTDPGGGTPFTIAQSDSRGTASTMTTRAIATNPAINTTWDGRSWDLLNGDALGVIDFTSAGNPLGITLAGSVAMGVAVTIVNTTALTAPASGQRYSTRFIWDGA